MQGIYANQTANIKACSEYPQIIVERDNAKGLQVNH